MERREYVNDFIYFVVNTDRKEGGDVMSVCSGVNLERFAPITKGRYGIGGNPVLSGLQLVKYDICTYAISKGAVPSDVSGPQCSGIATTGEVWHSEPLLINKADGLSADEIIDFGVRRLINKIISCSRLDYRAPEGLPEPEALQGHLEAICRSMPLAA
ncbi:MAG: hypothetical protein HZB33_04130 [Nitrospirae bacterium]|nr:hypothetical protein [Nitrospirota bacterium]